MSNKKKRILFLVLHRKNRSPGQRYRHEQYINHLENNGFKCTFSPLLSEKQDMLFYSSGHYLQKAWIGLLMFLKRMRDVLRRNRFDFIYVYRDAYFFGTFFEGLFSKSKATMIYDFDDSIWLMDKNPGHGILNALKNPNKVSKIIAMSDHVVVGNEYLKKYAQEFNSKVSIIPSTIDFKSYSEKEKIQSKTICIGWTGSFSTIKHFETVLPALQILKENYQNDIFFKLIGEPNYENKELNISGIPWKAETEAQDLAELDIGIMPLPDNEWTRGKCGMKGLQYMALGIPTIMSPVGVNSDIIQDGVNGYLAGSQEEWVDKLILLIENKDLRKRLGQAGRKTVEEHYSVEANKDKWLAVFQS